MAGRAEFAWLFFSWNSFDSTLPFPLCYHIATCSSILSPFFFQYPPGHGGTGSTASDASDNLVLLPILASSLQRGVGSLGWQSGMGR